MPGVAQETVRDLGQGVIQLAFRVRKFFCTVDNQDVAQYLSSMMRVWRVFYARGRCGKMSKMCKVFCVKRNNPYQLTFTSKPPSGALLSETRIPCRVAMRFTMDNPSPLPVAS